jgi:hypothetical protein
VRLPPATHLVVCVKGTRQQAHALLNELAERVEGLGLKLKPEKTGVTHIDEGFVFLGQRFIRRSKGPKRYVYTLVCDELGEERCKQIELVSCDMAGWIAGPVADRLPDAVRCVDPFHVVMLATDALDEVRREV